MDAYAEGRVITPPSNAAWRCRQFILATLAHAHEHVDVAFAKALGIQSYDPDDADQQDLVRAAISSLRKQQNALISTLSLHSTIAPELYAPIVTANTALAAMHNTKQVLRSFSQFCVGEYPLALGWAANVVPSSGQTANDVEIAEVLNDIIFLKARLAAMRFPPAVRDFIDQILKDLEAGVVNASFEGISSLNRAYRYAVSELTEKTEELRSAGPNMNDSQRNYLNEAAEKLDKVGKIASGFSATIEFAGKLAPLIGSAIS